MKGATLGKDPAVLWYFNDWMGGTTTLSRHLKGCYMDLLTAQFNTGNLSLDEIKTVLGSDFGPAWPALQKKFAKDDNGLYYNKRLVFELDKRKSYTKSRRSNLMGSHMGNENGNGIVIEKEKIIPSLEEFLSYAKTIKGINFLEMEHSLRAKYQAWTDAGWKDGYKQPIKAWKTKLLNTIPHLKPMRNIGSTNTAITSASPFWSYCPETWDAIFYKRIQNENYADRKIETYRQKLKKNGYKQISETEWTRK